MAEGSSGAAVAELEMPQTDRGIATKTNVEVLEKPVSQDEIAKTIPLAEDIAKFRTELEQQIFDEGLPKDQWTATYEQTIDKYPNLMPYKILINGVLNKAKAANEHVERVWKKAHGPATDQAEDNPAPQRADPEVAKTLCMKFFRVMPQGEVEAIKGAITIRIMVDDDYRKMRGIKLGTPLIEGASAFPLEKFGFSVLLIRKDLIEEHVDQNILHEIEHGKNHILTSARRDLIFGERLDMPEDILGRIRRREFNHPMQEKAKDEILAFFTYLDQFKFQGKVSMVILNDFLQEWGKKIRTRLTKKDGIYLPEYIENYQPTPEQIKSYEDNVNKATYDFIQLFELYFKLGYKNEAARMTINVLEQFPLHSWGAVSRLIQARHK